jgi:hypothetical protein
LKNWEWSWIIWQVIVPIFGPAAISAFVVVLWWTGDPKFVVNWRLLIDDLTPWALTFYAITLIGATMKDLWPRLSVHPVLGSALLITAATIAVFESFIVIWRHNPQFTPGPPVYAVTIALLGISIYLCHKGAKIR